jgi:predicted protein tyrosine phosphatase
MIEIHRSLFIGSEVDYESQVRPQPGWWVVHACKEPYHRQLLGYSGRAAPKNHPEYLLAHRDKRLYLNLIDADDPNYIPKEIIDAALAFVGEGVRSGGRVLVHCNLGESRSPSIGLLYLAARESAISTNSLSEAEADFRRIYPRYNPKGGMRGFLMRHWRDYVRPTE